MESRVVESDCCAHDGPCVGDSFRRYGFCTVDCGRKDERVVDEFTTGCGRSISEVFEVFDDRCDCCGVEREAAVGVSFGVFDVQCSADVGDGTTDSESSLFDVEVGCFESTEFATPVAIATRNSTAKAASIASAACKARAASAEEGGVTRFVWTRGSVASRAGLRVIQPHRTACFNDPLMSAWA